MNRFSSCLFRKKNKKKKNEKTYETRIPVILVTNACVTCTDIHNTCNIHDKVKDNIQ